jgi:hypothetical protein
MVAVTAMASHTLTLRDTENLRRLVRGSRDLDAAYHRNVLRLSADCLQVGGHCRTDS